MNTVTEKDKEVEKRGTKEDIVEEEQDGVTAGRRVAGKEGLVG